jgi:hypothetical protein
VPIVAPDRLSGVGAEAGEIVGNIQRVAFLQKRPSIRACTGGVELSLPGSIRRAVMQTQFHLEDSDILRGASWRY